MSGFFNNLSTIVCTPRDFEILQALGRCPLSTGQLLKLSCTFSRPFLTTRPLRRRMQAMASAGWVRVLQYASTSHGVENYYKLTTAGYRLLNGPKTPLPSRGFFRPVSLGLPVLLASPNVLRLLVLRVLLVLLCLPFSSASCCDCSGCSAPAP